MAQHSQSSPPQSGSGPVDTQKQNRPRKTWRQALQESAPLCCPLRTMR